MGSSEGAGRDAKRADDGWGAGDLDAADISADDDRRRIGGGAGDVPAVDKDEAFCPATGL